MTASPKVVVIAGPNGAGKSTVAPRLLRGPLGVSEFVNADTIARGLSELHPDRVAMAAGRIMMSRLRELAASKQDFAFETTLASRTFAPWLSELIANGYQFWLLFLWLPTADHAVARVAERVRRGGHDIPEATIRRRYRAGIRNFFNLYQPLAYRWDVYDNSLLGQPARIASGMGRDTVAIHDDAKWQQMCEVEDGN